MQWIITGSGISLWMRLSKRTVMEPNSINISGQPSQPKELNLARRRYQGGSLYLMNGKWYGRWREDEVREGEMYRVNRRVVLGTKADLPTRRLAQRVLDHRLSDINAPDYRPKPVATFGEFADQWAVSVLTQHKPSTQHALKSHLRNSLKFFNHYPLKDIKPSLIQTFISRSKAAPKTTKNWLATLKMVWKTAKAWGYVDHNPFEGLSLPREDKHEPRFFTESDMVRIIDAAPEPEKTLYWFASETGLRFGELAGLRWEDVDVSEGIVSVRQSVWRGKVQSTKSHAGVRSFAVSEGLTHRLADLQAGRIMGDPVQFVFHTSTGLPLDRGKAVRMLWSTLDSLGIERAGFHAFRHGSATSALSRGGDIKTVSVRLGHADPSVTLRVYAHALPRRDKEIASELGRVLRPSASYLAEASDVTRVV